MAKILFYIIFFGTISVSLFRPWVGVIVYFFIAVATPLAVWPWVFEGWRVAYLIGLSTILGFLGAAITHRIDFTVLRSKQNLYMMILWLCLIISYIFSPYELTPTNLITENPHYLISNMSKVILFYFISVLIIDNKQKCHYLVWVSLSSAIILIYWGNTEYFQGHMFGTHWTLIGPGYGVTQSVYVDENCFAMFFVMSIPLLYFMGNYYKNRLLKYFLWLNIPFAWHCIFLTGSRGGLVGLAVVTLFIASRNKKKIYSVVIIVALVFAFIYQSGQVMKDRSASAIGEDSDRSVQQRFESWEAGIKMMIDHPVTGTGIGNFLKAFPEYSSEMPHVAHNTIIQFAAESGAVAGLMYLFLCIGIFWASFKQKKLEALNTDPFILAVKESLTGSLAGFFICGLFLNLGTYELFYYLLVLNAVNTKLASIAIRNIDSQKIMGGLTK